MYMCTHAGVQTTELIIRNQNVQTDDPPATRNASIQVEVMTKSASTQTPDINKLSSPDVGKHSCLVYSRVHRAKRGDSSPPPPLMAVFPPSNFVCCIYMYIIYYYNQAASNIITPKCNLEKTLVVSLYQTNG